MNSIDSGLFHMQFTYSRPKLFLDAPKIWFFPTYDTKPQINVKQVFVLINLYAFRQRRARQIRHWNNLQHAFFKLNVTLISQFIKFCFATDLPKHVLGFRQLLPLYSNSFADLTLHNLLHFRYVGMLELMSVIRANKRRKDHGSQLKYWQNI